MTEFSGLHVATLTPFDSSGRIDFSVLRDHTAFLAESGVQGICPCGTTGEWLYLSVGEKARIVEAAVDCAAGRVQVMAGIGALQPREISLLAKAAESAGANAVFLTPPIYYPASDEAVFTHYATVSTACGLPLFAYNIPSHAANSISIPCVERLAAEGTISGIKDSTGDKDRFGELVQRFGERIRVMAASDSFATEGRKLGAHGFISALANIWPRSFVRLWGGDESVQLAIDSARNAVKGSGGIPALKHLATLRGYPFGSSRLPAAELTDANRRAIADTFARAAESGLI